MLAPGTQYPISEYAELFPDLAPEDYGRLVASIGENGLLEPSAVRRRQVLAAALHLQYVGRPARGDLDQMTGPVRWDITVPAQWRRRPGRSRHPGLYRRRPPRRRRG